MILDPYGEVIAECRELGDSMVSADLIPEKLPLAGLQFQFALQSGGDAKMHVAR